jgi:hypothetical protein
VVTMGCGDECRFFPGKRYEDEIRRRVEVLVAELAP